MKISRYHCQTLFTCEEHLNAFALCWSILGIMFTAYLYCVCIVQGLCSVEGSAGCLKSILHPYDWFEVSQFSKCNTVMYRAFQKVFNPLNRSSGLSGLQATIFSLQIDMLLKCIFKVKTHYQSAKNTETCCLHNFSTPLDLYLVVEPRFTARTNLSALVLDGLYRTFTFLHEPPLCCFGLVFGTAVLLIDKTFFKAVVFYLFIFLAD